MNFLTVVMLAFAILGAIDRALGNRLGLGKEFEKGFMLLGVFSLTVTGMLVISPLVATLLAPCADWIYATLKIDPSIIPASFFAIDMGGASLALEMTKNDSIGALHGFIISAMMGCTVSFIIPYALGVVKKEKQREVFLGFLCGLVTVPLGCLVVGVLLKIEFITLVRNLLPLILFSGLIICGLLFFLKVTVKIFAGFGVFVKILVTVGLVLGMIQFVAGKEVISGLANFEESSRVCLNSAIIMSGAFPFMYVVSKILTKPVEKLADVLHINETSAFGFLSTVVSCVPTIDKANQMDAKGLVLNAAFVVPCSALFGSHFAFTMAFRSEYVGYLITAKIISGVAAIVLAYFIYNKTYKKGTS